MYMYQVLCVREGQCQQNSNQIRFKDFLGLLQKYYHILEILLSQTVNYVYLCITQTDRHVSTVYGLD